MDEPAALVERLTERFRSLGASDPRGWAESEVYEDFAQLPRFLLLRAVWSECIDRWRQDKEWVEAFATKSSGFRRAIDSGYDEDVLGLIAASVATEVVFRLLERIDEHFDPDASEECPGWKLMEVDADGRLTGRSIEGLHESILDLDPSGRNGRDLLF